MVSALRQILDEGGIKEVVLIGYSGGGVLAWLMAERIPEVTHLVTIAANLDTDAWARLHGYSALTGSLNPAQRAPLPGHIEQLHLTGSRDRISPANLVKATTARQGGNVEVRMLAVDHRCCWEESWPSVLREL